MHLRFLEKYLYFKFCRNKQVPGQGTIAEKSRPSFVMLNHGQGPSLESRHRQTKNAYELGMANQVEAVLLASTHSSIHMCCVFLSGLDVIILVYGSI